LSGKKKEKRKKKERKKEIIFFFIGTNLNQRSKTKHTGLAI
jgi:hypothetical protein